MKKIDLFKSVPTGGEVAAIKAVLDSGWWAQGAKVKEFEEKFATYCGAKYAVATNSCSAALDIAVQVAPLGDEVTVTPLTFVSSALAILHAGKKVKFVDIDPVSLCTPEADIQVFYAGRPFGKGIIYDMAHYGGGTHHGLISCWSFHAVKNLPTGDGGMLTTNDEEIYRRAKALSWCGIDKSTFDRSQETYSWDYNIKEVGLKANMNDITAAIGIEQLQHLTLRNNYRDTVAVWYRKYLPKHITPATFSTTNHMYVVRVQNRDMLYDRLAANHVQAGVHYKPLYKYPIFPQTELPNTEQAWKEIITLPMHTELTEEDIKYICSLL